MPNWLRRTRAALLTGVIWALAWAPIGVLTGLVLDPSGSMDEPWLLIFAYPGFIGGVLFSGVLALRARRHTVAQLSIARVAGWGAAVGLLVGAVPFVIGEPAGRLAGPLLMSLTMSTTGVLSGLSAAGSLALARRADRLIKPAGEVKSIAARIPL